MFFCFLFFKINDIWGKHAVKCTVLNRTRSPGISLCTMTHLVCSVTEEQAGVMRVKRLRSWLDEMQPALELTIGNVFQLFQPARKLRREYCPWCSRLKECFSLDSVRMVNEV